MSVLEELRLRTAIRMTLQRLDDATDKRVEALIAAGGTALTALAAKLAAGTLTKRAFIAQGTALLAAQYQQAAAAGIAASGGEANDATLTSSVAGTSVDDLLDEDLFDGFAEDVAAGGVSEAQMALRAGLWMAATWAGYQWGKVAGAPAETEWDWELDEGAQHCADCEDNADGGPYTADTLPGFPGDGSTSCESACRCRLERA